MKLSTLFAFIITLIGTQSSGQLYRSYDGSDNNLLHESWGAVGSPLLQYVENGFSDGISTPAGLDRPSARAISNEIFVQIGQINDHMGMSAATWVFGQFIDHDISLTGDNHQEHIAIDIPKGDLYFDPAGTGEQVINLLRSTSMPGSGTSIDNPRKFPNEISTWIDASNVYGSDKERADWLRTFKGGKLKMSSGDLLPFNTVDGEYDSDLDPQAPQMANPGNPFPKYFVAGDVRANENPLLLAMHTLFVREHNRICVQLAVENPSWSDEALYQYARKLVSALIQHITYEEWLPTMGIDLEDYTGYDPTVNPAIMNVFAAAAYRWGHTAVNGELLRLKDNGQPIPQGHLLLRNAFFNPTSIMTGSGIAPLLKGMAVKKQQNLDHRIVDDMRNFLFGKPGQGGMDLAAINIARGRERGLPDYNTVRENFGLPVQNDFSDITQDIEMQQKLQALYGDVHNIDAYVGLLLEKPIREDVLFGPTVMRIMERQFQVLRDGDRYFYLNDLSIRPEDRQWISENSLSDVIKRNTWITKLQENVFMADDLISSTQKPRFNQFEIKALPNPNSGVFVLSIESKISEQAIIRIYDIRGKIVWQKEEQIYTGTNRIPVELINTPSGVYNIAVQMGADLTSIQILVSRP